MKEKNHKSSLWPLKLHFIRLSLLFCLLIYVQQCDNLNLGETVIINDNDFKEALLDQGVDKNRDGNISYREAENINTIILPPLRISDLTGIEAFKNLDTLSISLNPLKFIDISNNLDLCYLEVIGCELEKLNISNNVNLEYLDCSSKLAMKNYLTELDIRNNYQLRHLSFRENELSSIDLTSNSVLEILDCSYNELVKIDVSGNINLNALMCNNNQLSNLEISTNKALTKLISCGNDFTTLDFSANTNLKIIGIDNMPNLTQVCVWTLPFPTDDIRILKDFSPNVVFTTSCWN